MTNTLRDYKYTVDFRQQESGAWFAKVSIIRPDGSVMGPYAPKAASRSRETVQREAEEFVSSEINRDSDSSK